MAINNKLTMAAQASEKLKAIRGLMKDFSLNAYYVPSEDQHQSEYIAKWDGRRAWLTGFTGSAGFAIVTETEAALWTDGRYFNQAEKQLDNAHWTLMRAGLPGTLKKEDWLVKVPVCMCVLSNNSKEIETGRSIRCRSKADQWRGGEKVAD